MNFLCGTYFKHQCRLQLTDYKDPRSPEFIVSIDQEKRNDYVFCKPEFLPTALTHKSIGSLKLPDEFNLVTHNSDMNFSENNIDYVLSIFPQIKTWYTQNLCVEHPKVKPIPIGIANPKWSHGDQDRFSRVIGEDIEKKKSVYVNFNVSTNPMARIDCLEKIGKENQLDLERNYPNAASIASHDHFVQDTQGKYLRNIAASYFTVSPVGNGVDCHKTWESLYMKSIPIVTRWYGVEKFKELGIPMIILDDWSEFSTLKLDKELYDTLWGDFDPSVMDFDFFK